MISDDKDKDDDRDELDDDFFQEDEGIDPEVFAIRQSLERPDAQAMTTERLHFLIHEGEIDMDPPYQRDVVWQPSKQMEIIDSIYHNYYIPPVIFAVVRDEDGEETRVCVDGKQRLTSIQKFIDGQIPYKDPQTKKLWWYTASETTRKTRKIISQEGKRLFAEKLITCVEYRHLTDAAERDVFQRVQMGMSLSPAEKMQAISSPWANWINELEGRYISVSGGLADLIQFATKRGRNFQNLASMAYCALGADDDLRPVASAPKLTKWLNGTDGPTEGFKSKFNSALTRLLEIAPDDTLNQAFRKIEAKVAPVEFVYMGVLLYVMEDSREFTHKDYANALLYLRTYLRSQHTDIRLNDRVSKDCWDLIYKIDGRQVNFAVPFKETKEKTSKSGKRKGREDSDEEQEPNSLSKTKTSKKKPKKTTATD
ncbi:hypothetical protein BV25DRAFT_1824146 [Artomyces pyxidatus]|uniref:Uncharacterized protein n=1 Tax=Artomyces pyxidatus TaxID=48021 RepID=A0ACB8T4B1_9AGAM|nr:hypothetical protein BV25DRAFT_1824146 [Artomyces pyxidatus]